MKYYVSAETPKVRARDLGVPFEGDRGRLNAITDVPGVEVGHTVVAETFDADIRGQHVTTEHAFEALSGAGLRFSPT